MRNLARGMGYAWRNRRAIVKAGRAVGKGLRNYFGSNSTTTAQRDIRTQRAPRTKPVNKRFTRKVERVISAHAGRNTVLFNSLATALSSSASQQNWGMVTLFGANGSSGENSDIAHMLTFHEDATDIEDPESKNLFYNYGVLELGISNRNITDRVIVDLYEWKVRKGVTIFTSPSALINSNVLDEDILTDPLAVTNQISLGSIGATPYQIPDLCKNLKFGKRTTIQIAPGGTTTYTMARKKNRWISGLKVRDSTSFAFHGWTEGILIVFRGAPAIGTSAAASNIDLMRNRKYSWRAMDPDAKNEYAQQIW